MVQANDCELPQGPVATARGWNSGAYSADLIQPALLDRKVSAGQTPREIVERLHQETLKALRTPGVPEKLAQQGIEPMPIAPAAFDAQVKSEIDSILALVKAAGIKFNRSRVVTRRNKKPPPEFLPAAAM